MKKGSKTIQRPKQKQNRPGKEHKLKPAADTHPVSHPEGKLHGKVALITGGDSGIGKAVALLFAKEGARVAIAYLSETKDAEDTKAAVEALGSEAYLIKGDLSREAHCKTVVQRCISHFGQLDILINNAALHWESESLQNISTQQLQDTFKNNVFSVFWLTKYALEYLPKGGSIVNTTSVTAYRGSAHLIDYSATKGAIVSFTRSLAMNLADKGIRVNAVAPGPIWTPLIASSFDPKHVETFGSDTPLGRAGEPNEVAPAFLFLVSSDGSYINGQVIHPNGGEIING